MGGGSEPNEDPAATRAKQKRTTITKRMALKAPQPSGQGSDLGEGPPPIPRPPNNLCTKASGKI